MIEIETDIPTADGAMNTFVARPESGGPYPAILMLMDAPGVREALRDIARRIATSGYVVALPNLYYRKAREVVVGPTRNHPDAEKNIAHMTGFRTSIGHPEVIRDTGALLAWLAADSGVKPGKVGTTGYCMSGAYVVATAAAYPDRIACGASFYGTRLMEDGPHAPYKQLGKIKAELHFAFAEHDSYVPLDQVEAFKAELGRAPFRSSVEVLTGTEHGYAFTDRGVHHRVAAERHYEVMLDLYRRHL